ncbi:MAG: TonB-dependent receptor [Deltaproteobacteria bacterium]|nr:TonB-dependent receptor [Deltaproteobacteria bacterium]
MKKTDKTLLTLAVVFSFIISGFTAWAQETKTEEFTLEEITVTAQKREQDLQKVASSVDVIQGYELTEMAQSNLLDALKYVPTVTLQPKGEALDVSMRGLSNDNMPGDSQSAVAVTIDGSYSNNWGVGYSGLYDMQRIEVLAGPQGTLYSRNSTGGVVNMISNNPKPDYFEGSASVGMGNYNLVNTQGAVNVPLSKVFAFRAAFNTITRDGYTDNETNDDNNKSARLKLGITPSEDLSIILTYEYNLNEGRTSGNGVDAFEYEDDVDNPWHNPIPAYLYNQHSVSRKYYINLDWKTPIGTLTFLPYVSHLQRNSSVGMKVWDSGETGPSAKNSRTVIAYDHSFADDTFKEKSLELRMASSEDFFMKWILGLYYYDQMWEDEGYCYAGQFLNPNTGLYVTTSTIHGTSSIREMPTKAAFGNMTYPITNAFRVTAGGRYTSDKEIQKAAQGGRGAVGPRVETDYYSHHFDYMLGVEYDVGTSSMLWANYSTGYKHIMRGQPSQTLKSYEAGAKNRFLDNKLQLNASAYYYDYSNYSVRGQQNIPIIINSVTDLFSGTGRGSSRLYGIDVTNDYVITENDRINLSVSWESAKIKNVIMTYMNSSGETTSLLPIEYLYGGMQLCNAPEWSIVGSYEHRFDLANGAAITPHIDARYKSKYPLTQFPETTSVPSYMDVNIVNTEPSHFMFDANMGIISASGKYIFNAYVKNITNHAEKIGFMRGDLRINAPRTFGATMSVNF